MDEWDFQIKESPEGDWNSRYLFKVEDSANFQIKESPEGDWNERLESENKLLEQLSN